LEPSVDTRNSNLVLKPSVLLRDMPQIRRSLEEHRLEIICLALIILFIVLFLGLVVATAVRWPLPVDIEHGQRSSSLAGGGWRPNENATATQKHYRDSSGDTGGSRRTSFADSFMELKNGLARDIGEALPARDLMAWNLNVSNSLRRLSVDLPVLRRKSTPGAAYRSCERRDLEEGPMSVTGVEDATPSGTRRRSGKGDAAGEGAGARFDDSQIRPEQSLLD
jgi:hypothetical protein